SIPSLNDAVSVSRRQPKPREVSPVADPLADPATLLDVDTRSLGAAWRRCSSRLAPNSCVHRPRRRKARLRAAFLRADDGSRTRDLRLGSPLQGPNARG